MESLILIFAEKILEALYFSLFLILGKPLKKNRVLFTLIMIFEYIMLTSIIEYNVWFQFIYTFMTYINLKVIYKDEAIITDIFLFAAASIILIVISICSYLIVLYTIKIYYVALVLNRIILFSFLFLFRNKIKNWYKEFRSLWNRHHNPKKIKSLTLRNISVITFNVMFCVINFCMIFAKFLQ